MHFLLPVYFPHKSSKYLFLIVTFIPLAIWQETCKLFEDFDNIAKKKKTSL
jgi:hypothetical protein